LAKVGLLFGDKCFVPDLYENNDPKSQYKYFAACSDWEFSSKAELEIYAWKTLQDLKNLDQCQKNDNDDCGYKLTIPWSVYSYPGQDGYFGNLMDPSISPLVPYDPKSLKITSVTDGVMTIEIVAADRDRPSGDKMSVTTKLMVNLPETSKVNHAPWSYYSMQYDGAKTGPLYTNLKQKFDLGDEDYFNPNLDPKWSSDRGWINSFRVPFLDKTYRVTVWTMPIVLQTKFGGYVIYLDNSPDNGDKWNDVQTLRLSSWEPNDIPGTNNWCTFVKAYYHDKKLVLSISRYSAQYQNEIRELNWDAGIPSPSDVWPCFDLKKFYKSNPE
jgi:hypothetical protein